VVKLIQCADVAISHSTAPPGSKTYLAVEGRDSASIVLSGCDLRGAKRPFETSGDVQPGAVTENDNGPTTP
jgi:hypothetical protein